MAVGWGKGAGGSDGRVSEGVGGSSSGQGKEQGGAVRRASERAGE